MIQCVFNTVSRSRCLAARIEKIVTISLFRVGSAWRRRQWVNFFSTFKSLTSGSRQNDYEAMFRFKRSRQALLSACYSVSAIGNARSRGSSTFYIFSNFLKITTIRFFDELFIEYCHWLTNLSPGMPFCSIFYNVCLGGHLSRDNVFSTKERLIVYASIHCWSAYLPLFNYANVVDTEWKIWNFLGSFFLWFSCMKKAMKTPVRTLLYQPEKEFNS